MVFVGVEIEELPRWASSSRFLPLCVRRSPAFPFLGQCSFATSSCGSLTWELVRDEILTRCSLELSECGAKGGGGFFKDFQSLIGVNAKFRESMPLLKLENNVEEARVMGFREKTLDNRCYALQKS